VLLKNRTLNTSILASLLLVLGCSAADPSGEPESFIAMSVNGEPWRGNVYYGAWTDGNMDRVWAEDYVQGRYPLLDHIGLATCEEEVEDPEYPGISCDHGTFFAEKNGDAFIAVYRKHGPGSVHFDRRDEEVWAGRFDVDFVVEEAYRSYPKRRLPDTLRVREGRFHIVLSELQRSPYVTD
jgi:hypothetical protein